MIKKSLFLASSAELKEDRKEFEIFINRKNKSWVDRGIFLELIIWEDFLDAVSRTRLQDEYNHAIRECDLFVMLFFSKVGQYTEEEFETAFGQFKATNKPFIFTYFKDAEKSTGSPNPTDRMSLQNFQRKLDALGHFYTRYENIDQLKFHFSQQLDKLTANGFIQFKPDRGEPATSAETTYQATLTGNGAIAQGSGATAVGARGVSIGGNSSGNINTGTQINTGGGAYIGGNIKVDGDFVGRDKVTQGVSLNEIELLFEPLLTLVAQHATPHHKIEAMQQAEALKTEVAKGKQADDSKVANTIEDLAEMVPGVIGWVVDMFAKPILNGIVGPVTKYVLDKLKSG